MLSLSARSILKRSFVSQSAAARSYSSTIHDNDPNTLELEKQRNLSHKQHLTSTPISEAPGWNEHLASSSEAHVKADKTKDSLDALVTKTVKYVQSRHNQEERPGSREATYERDSVEGPLAGTPGANFKAQTEVYQEVLKDATPSEEAVKSDRGDV